MSSFLPTLILRCCRILWQTVVLSIISSEHGPVFLWSCSYVQADRSGSLPSVWASMPVAIKPLTSATVTVIVRFPFNCKSVVPVTQCFSERDRCHSVGLW